MNRQRELWRRIFYGTDAAQAADAAERAAFTQARIDALAPLTLKQIRDQCDRLAVSTFVIGLFLGYAIGHGW